MCVAVYTASYVVGRVAVCVSVRCVTMSAATCVAVWIKGAMLLSFACFSIGTQGGRERVVAKNIGCLAPL